MGARRVASWVALLSAAAVAASGAAFAADGVPPGPLPAPSPTAEPVKPPTPPKYDLLRYREDWWAYRCVDPCDRCDLSDRLKAISIGTPCIWLNVGGQLRARYESFGEQNFGSIPGDDSWLLTRARLHADLHLGDNLRVFAEGIYADQDEREAGPRPIDENHGDLINLFGEAMGWVSGATEGGLWYGRREMLFGKQRLIGPLDWGNTRRAFEGAGGWLKSCDWRLDAFWVEPVLVDIEDWDEADDHAEFAGAYFSYTGACDRKCEAYVLHLDRDNAKWQGVTGDESRWTVGTAAWGPIAGTRFDYDVEAAYQFGTFEDGDISAGMVSAEIGWKPCAPCWEPRIALGVDWASGDDDGAGGDLGTFNQLFPTGHLSFGWIDLVGRQNVVAARLTATVKPSPKVTVRADLHQFWRATEEDGLYTAAGALLRAAGGSDAKEIGTEADLQVKFAIDRHWELEAGLCRLWAGDFVRDTGPAKDVDFAYVSLTFTF